MMQHLSPCRTKASTPTCTDHISLTHTHSVVVLIFGGISMKVHVVGEWYCLSATIQGENTHKHTRIPFSAMVLSSRNSPFPAPSHSLYFFLPRLDPPFFDYCPYRLLKPQRSNPQSHHLLREGRRKGRRRWGERRRRGKKGGPTNIQHPTWHLFDWALFWFLHVLFQNR